MLEAPFSFAGELGDAASAPDGLCAPVRKDWCIWSLCYHWRPSDIGCTVTLRPKPIFSQEAIDLVDHAKNNTTPAGNRSRKREGGRLSKPGALHHRLHAAAKRSALRTRRLKRYPMPSAQVMLLPCAGEPVCTGVRMTNLQNLHPGEIRLFSAGGASLTLKNSGEIELNGLVITKDGAVIARQEKEKKGAISAWIRC